MISIFYHKLGWYRPYINGWRCKPIYYSRFDSKEVLPPYQVKGWKEYIYTKISWVKDSQLRLNSI